MFVASYHNTMAGAERRPKSTPKRDALKALVDAWAAKQAKQAEEARRAQERAAKARARIVTLDRPPRADLKVIIDLVARMHGVTFADVMGQSRSVPIVNARQAAVCALCEVRPDLSTTQIGRMMGRDHTTVVHARQIRGYIPRKVDRPE